VQAELLEAHDEISVRDSSEGGITMRYFMSLFPGFISVGILLGLIWFITQPWANFLVAIVGAK
jgi:hypothetical protein